MLHIFEGHVLSFLTTPDGQCSCLKEFSVLWLSKPTKVTLEPGQSYAGLFLVLWICRHKIGSFRGVFVVIMELIGFSTRWNFSDAHITARYRTYFSFNSLRRIWFVLKLTLLKDCCFSLDRCYTFSKDKFFHFWRHLTAPQIVQCSLII